MTKQTSPNRKRGDKAINRLAQAGHPSVLFGGKRYALSPEHTYGTKLDRETGKRSIVILLS